MKNSSTPHNLIIIGSGPAGLTAGIYGARANLKPLIIEGKNPGGQLLGTTAVENWPGEKSILGPQLIKNIKEHAQSLGCSFMSSEIVKADFSKSPFTLWTNKQENLQAQAVILACGATPKQLNCPGEQTYWGKGVTTCAVCDGALYRDKKVIIVGGGDTAMEDAAFMAKFTKEITVVHLLDKLTASHAMQQRVINNPNITIVFNSTVTEIKGDGEKVTEAAITNQKTKETKTVPVDGIFIAIGLKPNTDFLKGHVELTPSGHVALVNNEVKTATSVPGVFACGDVADPRYRQAIASAGTGCMAAIDAERYLSGLATPKMSGSGQG
jgi:thioredoxin reductase (NADPH)